MPPWFTGTRKLNSPVGLSASHLAKRYLALSNSRSMTSALWSSGRDDVLFLEVSIVCTPRGDGFFMIRLKVLNRRIKPRNICVAVALDTAVTGDKNLDGNLATPGTWNRFRAITDPVKTLFPQSTIDTLKIV